MQNDSSLQLDCNYCDLQQAASNHGRYHDAVHVVDRKKDVKRRELLMYVAPAIATIAVLPQLASAGSNLASGPGPAPSINELCVDDPKPAHGCKHVIHYAKRHNGAIRPTTQP